MLRQAQLCKLVVEIAITDKQHQMRSAEGLQGASLPKLTTSSLALSARWLWQVTARCLLSSLG